MAAACHDSRIEARGTGADPLNAALLREMSFDERGGVAAQFEPALPSLPEDAAHPQWAPPQPLTPPRPPVIRSTSQPVLNPAGLPTNPSIPPLFAAQPPPAFALPSNVVLGQSASWNGSAAPFFPAPVNVPASPGAFPPLQRPPAVGSCNAAASLVSSIAAAQFLPPPQSPAGNFMSVPQQGAFNFGSEPPTPVQPGHPPFQYPTPFPTPQQLAGAGSMPAPAPHAFTAPPTPNQPPPFPQQASFPQSAAYPPADIQRRSSMPMVASYAPQESVGSAAQDASVPMDAAQSASSRSKRRLYAEQPASAPAAAFPGPQALRSTGSPKLHLA